MTSSKVAILYWDSDNTAKIIYKKLEEGKIKHKVGKAKKTFIVKEVKPYWLWKKTFWTWLTTHLKPMPLYVFRHDNAFPHAAQWTEKKQGIIHFNWKRNEAQRSKLKNVKKDVQVGIDKDGQVITRQETVDMQEMLEPETLTEMLEQKTLRTLMTSGTDTKTNFMWLIMGAAIALPIGIIVAPMLGG